MSKYLPYTWKIYLALLAIYVLKLFLGIFMTAGPFILAFVDHYFVAYAVFVIGLIGLAFNLRLLSPGIWKFIFAVAAIYFLNFWVIHPVVELLLVPNSFSEIQSSRQMMVPFLPLLYALYHYAWKSDGLWETVQQE